MVRWTPKGPLCEECHNPMDRYLTRLEGWRTHPCCDPDYREMVRVLDAKKQDHGKVHNDS